MLHGPRPAGLQRQDVGGHGVLGARAQPEDARARPVAARVPRARTTRLAAAARATSSTTGCAASATGSRGRRASTCRPTTASGTSRTTGAAARRRRGRSALEGTAKPIFDDGLLTESEVLRGVGEGVRWLRVPVAGCAGPAALRRPAGAAAAGEHRPAGVARDRGALRRRRVRRVHGHLARVPRHALPALAREARADDARGGGDAAARVHRQGLGRRARPPARAADRDGEHDVGLLRPQPRDADAADLAAPTRPAALPAAAPSPGGRQPSTGARTRRHDRQESSRRRTHRPRRSAAGHGAAAAEHDTAQRHRAWASSRPARTAPTSPT